ncbi:uncharacterized protein LOC142526540 [Primulina tabacum]|uniref:uncharacterized protein LOC142526540 n=1 Tax=Primulina tabacum TaxID=48773 RepID=UPI003F59E99E
MHSCSQLVEDVLPEFSVDSAGENGLVFPAQEQDGNCPALEMLSIGMDTEQDGKSCTMNSASTLSSIVPVGERCTDIQSDGKDDVNNSFGKQILDGDESNFHAYSLTSAQPPAANSSEKMEESKNSFVEFREYELPDDEVSCPTSGSTNAIQSNEY